MNNTVWKDSMKPKVLERFGYWVACLNRKTYESLVKIERPGNARASVWNLMVDLGDC